MLLNDKVGVSVCDGCLNWRICKYSEEAQDREKQLAEFYEGAWTQYLDIKMSCKYKQCASRDDLAFTYNDTDYARTGWPSNTTTNSDGTPIGSVKIT